MNFSGDHEDKSKVDYLILPKELRMGCIKYYGRSFNIIHKNKSIRSVKDLETLFMMKMILIY